MHTLHAEMDKRNKDRRRSRGIRIDTDENINREESHTTHQQRRSANISNSFAAATGQPSSMGPMFVIFIQQKKLKSFSNLANEDPREFVERYEKLSSQWEDRAKVENFATYLEGAASDWLAVLKFDYTNIITISDDGIQSNSWLGLKWPELRRLFEKEFAEERAKQVFEANQRPGETDLNFFYRMLNLHAQSKLDLTEQQLMVLIKQHLNESYTEKFKYKDFPNIEAFRHSLKSFEEKRGRELSTQSKRRAAMAPVLADSINGKDILIELRLKTLETFLNTLAETQASNLKQIANVASGSNAIALPASKNLKRDPETLKQKTGIHDEIMLLVRIVIDQGIFGVFAASNKEMTRIRGVEHRTTESVGLAITDSLVEMEQTKRMIKSRP